MLIPRLRRLKSTRVTPFLAVILFFVATTMAFMSPAFASGALSTRSATLGTSLGNTATTYSIAFKPAGTTAINSVSVQACSGASTCGSTPSGFLNNTSTLATTQSGFTTASGSAATGLTGSWTVSTATAGTLKGTATSTSATSASTLYGIQWGNVTNPTASNATFYLWITTYSDTGYATPIDTGVVVVSTAGQITVTASVAETLTFTLATATVTLSPNPITTGAASTGTSTMSASTNGTTGYVITVNGTTMTSGTNTITAMAGTTSSPNSSQFGLNLVSNSSPSVGTNPTGDANGVAATGYSTANNFKFNTGDTVAKSTVAANSSTFTVSYIANVAGNTQAGTYSTVLTYICTPTF